MEAVAIDNLSAEVFADVLKNGAKEITGTGCMIVPKAYMKIIDEITDWKVEMEAARRLKNPDAKYYAEEEALAMLGLTKEDLKGWEDVEIE